MNPGVSIIIPCFQAEEYLDEAIASIQAQDYAHWRIIAVNDGSTDRTVEILTRWQSELGPERLQIVTHSENRGLGASRNSGIAAAPDEWVAFLDADDFWAVDHLSTATKALSGTVLASAVEPAFPSAPASIVFTETLSFWDTPEGVRYEKRIENPRRFPGNLRNELYVRCFTVPGAAVFAKTVWQEAGPFHTDRRIQGSEDLHFWISAFDHGFSVQFVSGGACHYRRHENNMTAQSSALAAKKRRLLSRWKLAKYRSVPVWLRAACILVAVWGVILAFFGKSRRDFWQHELNQAVAAPGSPLMPQGRDLR